jgi:hypothetical protein
MRPERLLVSVVLVLSLTACGSSKPPGDAAIADQALLRPVDLPDGFSESKEPAERSRCDPAVLFRRVGATAIAVSRGFGGHRSTVLETTGVFATTDAAETALLGTTSKKTQRCVATALQMKVPADVFTQILPPPPLGASARAIRYTVEWGSGIYIEVVSMRVGRSISSIAFVTESRAVAPALRTSILSAAANRSRTALSQ